MYTEKRDGQNKELWPNVTDVKNILKDICQNYQMTVLDSCIAN